MAPLRFAANLMMMFSKEYPNILDRYEAAKNAGFQAVECTFMYDVPLNDVVTAKQKNGLQQILLNSFPGDLGAGELGFACLGNHVNQFRETLDLSIQYCKALDCKKLHVVSGKLERKLRNAAAKDVYISNLKYVAERLAPEGIVGLIEPINAITVPHYYMDDFNEAIQCITEVNSSHLKLQLDFFHLQHVSGNLTNMLKQYFPYIGHIQIAQVPKRGEPSSFGEIRYDYIFKLLEDFGYNDWIGCEYIPEGNTVDGLKWLQEYGLSL